MKTLFFVTTVIFVKFWQKVLFFDYYIKSRNCDMLGVFTDKLRNCSSVLSAKYKSVSKTKRYVLLQLYVGLSHRDIVIQNT